MPIQNITSSAKFNQCLKKNQDVLCLFYWKLCGHCIDFAPIWNAVTRQYKDRINVANIELDTVKKLDDQYRVYAFPTVIIYRNGQKYAEFTKNRNEQELHKFIKKYLLKDAKEVPVKKPAKKTATRLDKKT